MRKFGFLCVLTALCAAPFAGAQAASPQAPVFHTQAREVLFDVVVTDHHGHILRDIKPEEVTVEDNGARQSIRSMRLVSTSTRLDAGQFQALTARLGVAGRVPVSASLQLPSFNLVALVFDHMNPRGRQLARDGALHYLNKVMGPHDYAAVFVLDRQIYALAPFTRDKTQLLRAVEEATGSADVEVVKGEATTAQAQRAQAQQLLSSLETGPATPTGPGSVDTTSKLDAEAAVMAAMTADAIDFSAKGEVADQGRALFNSLLGLIGSLGEVPGRKALIFFEDWLPVNADNQLLYHGMLNAANRALVSFYTVDPDGLEMTSDNAEAVQRLQTQAALSRGMAHVGAVSLAEANAGESQENIQFTSRRMLDGLAEDTGGFYTGNVNDLASALGRISGDLAAHYEIAFAPSTPLDNTFHKLTVRVARKDVTVRARAGYFAGNAPGRETEGQQAIEAAANVSPAAGLDRVLGQDPPPHDVPLYPTVLSFPEPGQSISKIALRVPLAELTSVASDGQQQAHFAVAVSIKTLDGTPVGNFSTDVPLVGKDLKQRNYVFLRDANLAPGTYLLSGAVLDAGAAKSALATRMFTVPAADGQRLHLGDLVLVSGENKLSRDIYQTPQTDPLVLDGVQIVPNIAQPMIKSTGASIGLLLTALVPKIITATPQLTLIFKRDDGTAGKVTQAMPKPDKLGHLTYLASVPMDALSPGHYKVAAIVRAGTQSVESTTQMVIVP